MTTTTEEVKVKGSRKSSQFTYGSINTHASNSKAVVLTDERELTNDSVVRYISHFIKAIVRDMIQACNLPSLTDSVKVFISPIQVKNAKNDKVSAKFTSLYKQGKSSTGKSISVFNGYSNELLVTQSDDTLSILKAVIRSIVCYITQSKMSSKAFKAYMIDLKLMNDKGEYLPQFDIICQQYISNYGEMQSSMLPALKGKSKEDNIQWVKFNLQGISRIFKLKQEEYNGMPLEVKSAWDKLFTLHTDNKDTESKNAVTDTSYKVKVLASVLADMRNTLTNKLALTYSHDTLEIVKTADVELYNNMIKHHAWVNESIKTGLINKAKNAFNPEI